MKAKYSRGIIVVLTAVLLWGVLDACSTRKYRPRKPNRPRKCDCPHFSSLPFEQEKLLSIGNQETDERL